MIPNTNPPAPVEENFVIQRGITMLDRQYQFIGENNTPINYTGFTLAAQARRTVDDSAYFDLAPEWIDASIGSWKFPEMTPTETNNLTAGEYHYDVVPISASSERDQPPMVGQIDVVTINTHL